MAGHRETVVLLGAALLLAGPTSLSAAPRAAVVDEASVPVGNAPLGAFPYLDWSETEFTPQNTPVDQPFGHFLFWNGRTLRDVEGRTFLVTLVAGDGRATFNEFLMRRTVEAGVARMGSVRLTSSRVPADLLRAMSDTDKQSLGAGLGDLWNDPVQTWLIRRPDRDIWIQCTDNSAEASLAIVEGGVRP